MLPGQGMQPGGSGWTKFPAPPGRGMPHPPAIPYFRQAQPGQPLPERGMMLPEPPILFEQGMPTAQEPMISRQAMLREQPMLAGQVMPFERGMLPWQGIPPGHAMPPGGMPHGQPMPPVQGMTCEQPIPPERLMMSPAPPMFFDRGMLFQPGSSPAQNSSRENFQVGSEPRRIKHNHYWVNRSSRPSSLVHPYKNNQGPPLLHYDDTLHYRRLRVSPTGFYCVKLRPCSGVITPVSLLSSVSHIMEKNSVYMPRRNSRTFFFIVDQYNVAQRLLNQDNLIRLWNGTPLRIQVEPRIPAFKMDENIEKAINSVLKSVLERNNSIAVLTKFYTNRIFIEKNVLCSLNMPYALGHVVDVLFSLAPNLVTLILDDNSLSSLEEAGRALGRFLRLKTLSLANNKISSFAELGHLTALKLDALVLGGNICMTSLDWLNYKNEVQAVLPTITTLDGQKIEVSFYWDNPELPDWKPTYFPKNEPLKFLSFEFISRFFKLYDEMGRSNLSEAYHPQATLSLTCDLNFGSKWRLHDYLRYDRNLLISENTLLGNSLPILFQGPEAIVSALKTLPNTDHYLEDMTFDLIELPGNSAQIIISGFFKEFNQKKVVSGKPFKHFHRCLIVVYRSKFVQIVNDSLVIRYPTNSQLSKLTLIRENRLQKSLVTKFENIQLSNKQ